eukprot:s2900_g7.t1
MCTDGVSFKIMLLGTGLLYGSERCCSRVGCIGGYVYYTFTDVICFVLVWTHISSRPSLCCAPPYWPGRAAQEARIFAVEQLDSGKSLQDDHAMVTLETVEYVDFSFLSEKPCHTRELMLLLRKGAFQYNRR